MTSFRAASAANPILSVAGLTKRYGRGEDGITAVDDVGFSVGAGEVVGLLGPNGAGKTTTIKCIAGLITPTDGSIVIDGIDAARRRHEAATRIATMLEGTRAVYWRLNPRENVEYLASLRGIPRRVASQRVDDVLERFGLTDKASVPAMKLSRGMQQKLALACCVAVDAPLLLLDEPTLGLDVETSRELRGYIRELAQQEGKALLLSSHDMHVVKAVADRVVIINKGRVVVDDEVDKLVDVFRARTFRVTIAEAVGGPLLAALRDSFASVVPDPEDAATVTVSLRSAAEFYDLVESLRANGAVVESIDRAEPDLEEIFVRVVNGQSEIEREVVTA